jgi:hypothetical protein
LSKAESAVFFQLSSHRHFGFKPEGRAVKQFISQCATIAVFVIALVQGAQAAQLYHLTDLGDTGDGASDQYAWGINASGEVSGGSRDSSAGGPTRTYLWKPSSPNAITGSIQNLNITSPGFVSAGYGINDYGQVASYAGTQAILWTPSTPQGVSGSKTTVMSGYSASGEAINNYGQVVGYVQATFNSSLQGYVWTPNAQQGSAGVVAYMGSILSGINGMGQIVGEALWTPTTPHGTTFMQSSLGDLPGGGTETHGYAINASGQVTGFGQLTGASHAVFWSPTTPNGSTGTLLDLGDLSGGSDGSTGNGINDPGTIVGVAHDASGPVGFIWTSDTGMLALNTLLDSSGAGWNVYNAQDINNSGQIAALASYDPDGAGPLTGYIHGVLLTPAVPEPTAFIATATCCAGAVIFQRRRRRRIREKNGTQDAVRY